MLIITLIFHDNETFIKSSTTRFNDTWADSSEPGTSGESGVRKTFTLCTRELGSRLTFSDDFTGDFEPLKKGQNPPPLGLFGFGALEGDLPGEPRKFHM